MKGVTGVLTRGGTGTQTRTEGRPCDDAGRRQQATSRGERCPWEAAQPTISSQTSRLQNCEEMPFCSSSHLGCGTCNGSSSFTGRIPRRRRRTTALIQMEEQLSRPRVHHLPADTESQGLPGCCRVGAGQGREDGYSG